MNKKEYYRIYRANHREKANEYQKYYRENLLDKEKRTEYMREYMRDRRLKEREQHMYQLRIKQWMIPWRDIEEDKAFTEKDMEYIKENKIWNIR